MLHPTQDLEKERQETIKKPKEENEKYKEMKTNKRRRGEVEETES
jgi:hypothetical protein